MSSGLSSRGPSAAPIVGILGGIGAGKSSVVKRVEGLKLQVLDADKIGHELLSDPAIADQIRKRFGSEVIDEQGKIVRAELATRVFGTTNEHQAAKRDLETILHPKIRQAIEENIKARPHDVDVTILDAALLLEAGWDAVCDSLVYIDTPQVIREERVVRDRGWSAGELQRREATQLTIKRKRDAADFVIDNSGSVEAASEEMGRVLRQIVKEKRSGNTDGR